MRIVRFEAEGEVRNGELDGSTVVTDTATYHANDVSFLPPSRPTKILAAGKNYPDHIEEMAEKGIGDGEIPEFPFLFYKPPSCLIGHEEYIEYPDDAENVHFEGEVGVIVGERCRSVSVEDARDVLAGYTALNDVSFRDWAGKEHQWVRAKGLDTFLPVGPCLQTDLRRNISFETHVNGELKQSGNTGDMVFSIEELVSEITQYMTLEKGDIIAIGTPSGVGPIEPGDVVEVTVDGVGTLQNEVR